MVSNEKNKLILMRAIIESWDCMDYRKLNSWYEKDPFLMPSMDQMLDCLVGGGCYYFLVAYSSYIWIFITIEDWEKIIFTYPYGIFVFMKILFGLRNAFVTFQHFMISILSDIKGDTVEVFIDDFLVWMTHLMIFWYISPIL